MGEWPIITDPRLAELGARVVVMEWHQPGCPEPDSQALAVRSMQEAGYRVAGIVATHGGALGDLWAVRG